jgi:putative chitinase
MSDEKVTRLVKTEGTTRVLEMNDGSVVERTGGSVAWRNNNPGNMKFGYADSADTTVKTSRTKDQALHDAQKLYKGVVALDQWGNAVFESREAGRAAQIQLLERKMGGKTVEEAMRVYSSKDYSGETNYSAQADYIFKYGDRHGVDLRNKKVGDMSDKEKAALADGIAGFEGWKVGQTKQVSGPTREAPQTTPQTPDKTTPEVPGKTPTSTPTKAALPSAAILNEAEEHFLRGGKRYEYGRPDHPRPGRDSSRLERDNDGDGKLGVDCSAFVWRSLKNAGYDVKGDNAAGFTTAKLFNGGTTTPYAKEHFDVVSAADARKPGGNLKPGDILMFSSKDGQHVGIFKGYDEKGQIKFVGSQGSTGPAEVTIKPGGYWDGGGTKIVGALRAKPEFQVRQPLHGNPDGTTQPEKAQTTTPASRSALADGKLSFGEKGADVKGLQESLIKLGIKDDGGKLLTGTGNYGEHTKQAVANFQKANGIEPTGVADKATLDAIGKKLPDGKVTVEKAEITGVLPKDKPTAPLVSDAGHPNNALYAAIGKQLPAGTKPEAIANITLQAMENGITSPDKLKGVMTQGSDVYVTGTTPGFRAKVDLEAPTPSMQAMSDHMKGQTDEEKRRQSQVQTPAAITV